MSSYDHSGSARLTPRHDPERSPYTDLGRPPLNVTALRRALVVPGGLWTRLELYAETASTNADVAAEAQAGVPEGLVVVAERQTAGRGRRGRTWESPSRAGIATSVLLRPGETDPGRGWPPAPPATYGWLPLLAGVALVETVARVAELVAVLKWPNDLLVTASGGDGSGAYRGFAKCGGILAEAVPGGPPENTGASAPAIVLGVGLNVTLREPELPVSPTGLPVTSLSLAAAGGEPGPAGTETGAADRDPLLRSLLRGIATWYQRWREAGGDVEASGLYEAYLRHCATIGRDVRVLLPGGGELAGTATTVDTDGRLVVRADGAEHRVAAGDVLHLR